MFQAVLYGVGLVLYRRIREKNKVTDRARLNLFSFCKPRRHSCKTWAGWSCNGLQTLTDGPEPSFLSSCHALTPQGFYWSSEGILFTFTRAIVSSDINMHLYLCQNKNVKRLYHDLKPPSPTPLRFSPAGVFNHLAWLQQTFKGKQSNVTPVSSPFSFGNWGKLGHFWKHRFPSSWLRHHFRGQQFRLSFHRVLSCDMNFGSVWTLFIVETCLCSTNGNMGSLPSPR